MLNNNLDIYAAKETSQVNKNSKTPIFTYLKEYQSFQTVKEMDAAIKNHIYYNFDRLTKADTDTLLSLSRHSLAYPGACHVKAETLSKEVDVTSKTIYRATKKLAELKIITKINKTRKHGIKGASIYKILPNKMTQDVPTSPNTVVPTPVSHLDNTQNTQYNNDLLDNFNKQSFNSLNNNSLNHLKINTYNTYTTFSNPGMILETLKSLYFAQPDKKEQNFEELVPAVLYHYKTFKTHLDIQQLGELIVYSMKTLLKKTDVRKEVSLLSDIIKKQCLKAIESKASKGHSKEIVPDWFYNRNDTASIITPENTAEFNSKREEVIERIKNLRK